MEFDPCILFQEIALSELVSFDVFDTALQRKLARPTDLFVAMEAKASDKINQKTPSFFQDRLDAEASAKSRARLTRRQITLENIYEEFRLLRGLSASQSEMLQQLEISMEKEFIYAHPLILKLYLHALSLNKNVIFLTDMYLPSDCLKVILESQGYIDAKVFVSAEMGGNKASGKLYGIVQNKLQTSSSRCLHFGDNFYADYFRARLNGWRAVWTIGYNRRPDSEFVRPSAPIQDNSISRSIAIGLGRKSATSRAFCDISNDITANFWDEFGYDVVGPIYFNFLHWLCRQAHQDDIQRLLFCARDGFPLLRGLDILKKVWSVPLEATYLFASRRLINVAGIRELNSETLDFLLMPNPGLTVRDFVLRLNLDPAAHRTRLLELGFESLDVPITHDYFGRFLKPIYKIWLIQWLKAVQIEFFAEVAQGRLRLHDYFQEMKIERSDTALVDIGWKGTVVQAVHNSVREHNPKFKLKGYFFGTFAAAESLMRSGGQFQSFFMHLGRPSQRQHMIAANEGLLELLFSAPHGSIIGIQPTAKGTMPIYAECEYTAEQLVQLERMREGAYRFIEDAALLLPDYLTCAPSSEQVDRCISLLLRYPTKEQARHLGRMPYRVNYGNSDKPRAFAAPLEESSWRPSLRQIRAFGKAPWKRGFLAQMSPSQGWLLQVALLLSGLYAALGSGTLWKSLRWAIFRK
jgi:FMN phosphatase YigB (HAD superfamily)